jgi:hypothetical protein
MTDSYDNDLRGIKLPNPRFYNAPLSSQLQSVKGYKHLQTFFPTLSKLFRLNKFNAEDVWFDTKWRIHALDCSGTSGNCQLLLEKNVIDCSSQEFKSVPAYLKVSHLLDPTRWIQGKYSLPKESGLPWHSKTWTNAWHKLQDPWNQAYVETLASYAVGRLCEEDVSPHFNLFYGAFCARADAYRYNMNDEFASFRNHRWFWKAKKNNLYKMVVLNGENPSAPVDAEILEEFINPPEFEDSEDDSSELSELECSLGELESLKSVSIKTGDDEDTTEEEESDDDDSELNDEYIVYAELENFPVMLLLTQKNTNTMDSLLSGKNVGCIPNTPEWEEYWSAWIFQVIAACTVMQKFFGMTHNDLHTNNIVWTETDIKYLWYKNTNGQMYKVPTFGKLFKIIDFGRAIFKINGTLFISDDFRNGNDAEGQYSFPPLVPKPKEVVYPNPSFDLCRLSVSLFEALFPVKPKEKKGRKILSEEEGLIVRETESDLYNVLWMWMIDDEDNNVLMESDGSERFPDFDLYKHIAANCHKAKPSEQFEKPAFARFQTKNLPADTKIYSLFC